MKIEQHNNNDTKVAEVISDSIIINSIEDGLNLLGDLYYQGFNKIIVHEVNITPDFFNLKTGYPKIKKKNSTRTLQLL